MAESLTCEKVLELIKETNRLSSERLEKELRESRDTFEEKLEKGYKKSRMEFEEKLEKGHKKSRMEFEEKLDKGYRKRMKEFEEKLEKEYRKRMKEFEEKLDKGFEKSRISLDAELRQSRKEFDKKLGELTGTLGRFVEGLVKPKLLEMFRKKGVDVTDVLHNVEIHDAKGQKETQIDLLLINAFYSIAVEVKTTLNVEGVKEHLKRLDRLQKNPKRYVKGTILLGAVAGMIIQGDADKYAYRKGLYVLKQKGEIVEIANDNKFKPKEWIVP